MKLYYQDEWITLYLGDARDVLSEIDLTKVDAVVTDPPYGINGGRGTKNKKRAKGNYQSDLWQDNREYIQQICVPLIESLINSVGRVVITPGAINLKSYPQWDDMGDFFSAAAVGCGKWGFQTCNPILYYGRDPRAGKGIWPNGRDFHNMPFEKDIHHPCVKPWHSWKWLVEKASLPGETVLDPFVGSGTTLLCARALGRKSIGIEIEEKYCKVAVDRIAPKALRN